MSDSELDNRCYKNFDTLTEEIVYCKDTTNHDYNLCCDKICDFRCSGDWFYECEHVPDCSCDEGYAERVCYDREYDMSCPKQFN